MTPRYDVYCPTCAAPPGQPCRALLSGRVTDTHVRRIEAQHTRPAPSPGDGEPRPGFEMWDET